MIVEISGGGFVNKGAQLMLQAAADELRTRVERCVIALDDECGSFQERCGLGFLQVPTVLQPWRQQGLRDMLVARLLGRMVPRRLARCGCCAPEHISALVDVSGFLHSDRWGPAASARFAARASHYATQGKPVVLLPQTFGPFEDQEVRRQFAIVARCCTAIYARDRFSYEHVYKIPEAREKLRQAPDITLFYPRGAVAFRDGAHEPYVCIIPNMRVLDRGAPEWGERYKPLLLSLAARLVEHGFPVRVVVHEYADGDQRIAEELVAQANQACVTLAIEHDPVALKRLIGRSLAIVGSRYHSLVAALSCGTPCLCLGWAHKYDGLMADFGLEEFLVGPNHSDADVLSKLDSLVDPGRNSQIREQIIVHLEDQRPAHERMWSDVTAAIVPARTCG